MSILASGAASTDPVTYQREFAQLFRAELSKAGVDFSGLDELHKKSLVELAELQKKKSLEVLRESAALASVLERDLSALRAQFDTVINLDPPSSAGKVFLLDTASSISSSTGLNLTTSEAAHLNNSAEFDYRTSGDNVRNVVFSYNWDNPTGKAVVLNVTGFISFNGVLNAGCGGGWSWGSHHANSRLDAYISLKQGGNTFRGTSEFAGQLNIDSSGYIFDVGAIGSETIFRGLAPAYYFIAFPAGSSVQIDVVGSLTSNCEDGNVEYNFTGDGRKVISAAAIVNIIS